MKYTVIGYYWDDDAPFVEHAELVDEDNPMRAALQAVKNVKDRILIVVTVLEGHHDGVLGNTKTIDALDERIDLQ